ncbi:iron-sulfur cluster assembly protein [Mesorhizobium sp. ISC25]|uniref:metal-sulfur cluster assembly factor n=1 Tax=Mesorhizobium sp. ISC25 TaxID=3077335 RepID=UPI0035DB0717
MTGTLDDQIAEALGSVYDPCSLASNAPVSIIDMGLIKSWTVDDVGNLHVTMCVTSACCTMAPNIVRGAVAALTAIPGIKAAEVKIDPSVFWTPDSMTERGRETLRRRREQSLAQTKTTPQQWRQQVPS